MYSTLILDNFYQNIHTRYYIFTVVNLFRVPVGRNNVLMWTSNTTVRVIIHYARNKYPKKRRGLRREGLLLPHPLGSSRQRHSFETDQGDRRPPRKCL